MADVPHRYTITPVDPGARLYRVTLAVAQPDPHGQQFAIPAWIPGSYMIRDYARHVVAISATAHDEEVELVPLDKSRWQAAPVEGPLTLTADIHAFDPSVRGAHLDTTHAYFNGPCVFPSVVGQEQRPVEVEICPPPTPVGKEWRVATAMRRKDAPVYGYGTYEAADYDELIDHPVEIGDLLIGEFEAAGIPHVIAIRGNPQVDMGRLCRDLSALCAQHLEFLGPPAGLDRYVFLLQVVNGGYGGLEHRWSSSLVCSRDELPTRGDTSVSTGYRRFLGLCSHEYFHLWNVKRIKPAAFTPFDLQTETHTGLLWVFEGITSYYDNLTLLRAGLITVDSYFELLGQVITRIQRTHGRFRQSVEESSFYAWTKFYKQDANATNAIVSYYAKGALIALALDLTLRHGTDNRISLDEVMHECWKRYGESGEGMPERGLESVAAELSGMELGDFFARYVRGTADLPLAQLLRETGVELHLRGAVGSDDAGGKPAPEASRPLPWLGARLAGTNGDSVVRTVQATSPAERAGLAPDDVSVAFDNVRLTAGNLDTHLAAHLPGDKVTITVFRRDTLLSFKVKLEAPPEDTAYLTVQADCDSDAERRRNAWLGTRA
ncbi:MAG: PDZ domain-containing protein [Woeseiaceae bacterium]|nr:PDZ domain-containing protein [Woeseiaceae bacterium]